MSIIPFNSTFKKQVKTLVPNTFKKGVINNVNVANRTANVSFTENPQTIIKNIPVSSSIDITTINNGMACFIQLFDETNPNNMLVVSILGQSNLNFVPVPDGTYTVGLKLTGGGTNGTITTKNGRIIAIQEAT